MALANDHGGRDNTTVIVVDVVIYDETPAGGVPVIGPMSNVEEALNADIGEQPLEASTPKRRVRFSVARVAIAVGIVTAVAVVAVLIFG